MRIAIGSDHAGFALKEAVKAFLTAEHREVLDLGTHSTDPVDYSDYAEAVGRALRKNRAERGILFCGSGVDERARAGASVRNVPGVDDARRLDLREQDSRGPRRTVPRHLFGAPGR